MAYNRDRLSAETWQAAINFANERIDQLKTLVKIFGEYRDAGHPFPGQQEGENFVQTLKKSIADFGTLPAVAMTLTRVIGSPFFAAPAGWVFTSNT